MFFPQVGHNKSGISSPADSLQDLDNKNNSAAFRRKLRIASKVASGATALNQQPTSQACLIL